MGRRKIDRSKQVFHNVSTTLVALLDSASVLKTWSGKLLQNTVAVEIKAVSLRSSIHGARKRMKKGKSRRQISRVLEGLDLKRVEDETNAILRADAKNRFQGQVIDIAVDIHGIPYHGLSYEKKEEVNRSKQKDGTTRFHMFATAYFIGKNNKRFTLAIIFVPLGTTMRNIVRGLLYVLRRYGITIRRLLLDKGFYSIEVVKLLRRLNIGFIIPMRGNRLKKKKGSYSTVYTMKSTIDGKPVEVLVRAVSVIKYNRGKRFKHHGAMQPCFIVYGMDMSLHRIASRYPEEFIDLMKDTYIKRVNGRYEEVEKSEALEREGRLRKGYTTAYDEFFRQGTYDAFVYKRVENQSKISDMLLDGIVSEEETSGPGFQGA